MKKFFLNLAISLREQRAEEFRKALRELNVTKLRRMLENGFNPNHPYRTAISEPNIHGAIQTREVKKRPLELLSIDWLNGIFSKQEERMRRKSSMQDVYALIKSYGGK